jgi:hypothetical protein
MPESPKTRYRVPRARKLGAGGSNLTVTTKRGHQLILQRGRAGWRGDCSCGSWSLYGNESKVRVGHTDHIAQQERWQGKMPPSGHELHREIADPFVTRPRYFGVCSCGWRTTRAMAPRKLADAHAEHVSGARATE